MQEMNSTYSIERCQPTLSEEALMQDAVCDVLPYSSTEANRMQAKTLRSGACAVTSVVIVISYAAGTKEGVGSI